MVQRFLLIALLLCASAAGATQPVVVAQLHTLHSSVLNEDRTYRVSVPDSYGWAKDQRYPVLYVLDTVGWPLPVPESVINELAYEALATGNAQSALALFQRIVPGHPNSANAHDGLADALEKAENWSEAAKAAQRAADLASELDLPNREYFTQHAAILKARLAQEPQKSP